MSHTCKQLNPGCYKCELNVDELEHAFKTLSFEVAGVTSAIDVLVEHRRELREDMKGMNDQIVDYRRRAKRSKT